MKYAKTLAYALLLSAMTGITACAGTPSSPEIVMPFTPQPSIPGAAVNELCSNPLFPVKQGASWVYISTGGPAGTLIYTDTISEIHADGFTLTSQFENAAHTQEWKCSPQGLTALQPGGSTAAGISTQGMTAEFTTTDINGVSIPKEITDGMTWQHSMNLQGTIATPSDQQSQSSGTYLVDMQYLGRESVTVTAGTFDAYKFQANSKVNVSTDFQGISLPITFDGTTIFWYAPGVGYIKSIENGNFSGTTFTTTTELQTYNIPQD